MFITLAYTIAALQLLGLFFQFMEKFGVLLTAATPFLLGYMAYLQKRQEKHMEKQDKHLEKQDQKAEQIHKKVDGMTDKLVSAEKIISKSEGFTEGMAAKENIKNEIKNDIRNDTKNDLENSSL